ncbi:MAG: hypothetical protein DI606_19005 [Sphingobium sp.]|nr:MAG: hypothetical protein DI606_19005 [Sphingobium sp.]
MPDLVRHPPPRSKSGNHPGECPACKAAVRPRLLSKTLYKGRNAIERMFCRLKDCRRLATRYDKLAANFLGNIHLAAAIMWWL